MILALHLKRFKYMEQLHRYTKLSYRVVFPLELRLFNTSSDAVNLDRMYDLVAVVVHCGRWGQAGSAWREALSLGHVDSATSFRGGAGDVRLRGDGALGNFL